MARAVSGPTAPRRGSPALPQTLVLAPLLRDVMGQALVLDAEQSAIDALIDALRRALEELAPVVPSDLSPRRTAEGPGRVYLDHASAVSTYNPCFPPFELTPAGEQASGSVEFPIPFEGPPGIVHGGFLGLFFDAAVQEHNCALGVAGKTVSLQVDFVRPAPLLKRLTFELGRTVDGRRSTTDGVLLDDGEVCTRASVVAVVGDPSKLAPVALRESEA